MANSLLGWQHNWSTSGIALLETERLSTSFTSLPSAESVLFSPAKTDLNRSFQLFHKSSIDLVGIAYAEFDDLQGQRLVYQIPFDNLISKERFDAIDGIILPKEELYQRHTSITFPDMIILGFPLALKDKKYPRNQFSFNICFVLSPNSSSSKYEPVLAKLVEYMSRLEQSASLLSNSEHRKELKNLFEQIYEGLSSKGCCKIAKYDIYLRFDFIKFGNFNCSLPKVTSDLVPLLVKYPPECSRLSVLCSQLVCYMDGSTPVVSLARKAGIDLQLCQRAVAELAQYGVVFLLPPFHYSARYVTGSGLQRLAQSSYLQEQCCKAIALHGHTKPIFPHVFRLYCSLRRGLSVRQWCLRSNPRFYGVDEECFIQWGVIMGVLRPLTAELVKLSPDLVDESPRLPDSEFYNNDNIGSTTTANNTHKSLSRQITFEGDAAASNIKSSNLRTSITMYSLQQLCAEFDESPSEALSNVQYDPYWTVLWK